MENKSAVWDILSTQTSVGNHLWRFPALLRAHGLQECTCFLTLSQLLWAARTGMSPPLLKIPEVAATKVIKKNSQLWDDSYQHRLFVAAGKCHSSCMAWTSTEQLLQRETTQCGATGTRIHIVCSKRKKKKGYNLKTSQIMIKHAGK